MLQHSQHQRAFRPILHPSPTTPAALMGTQDSNFNTRLPRGTLRPSFAPITAFHRAAQKSISSAKQVRWGAQHVCIAWKIYYHERLKKMQQKPDSLQSEPTPEYSASSLPDRVQHKESDQPSCKHPDLDSPCGYLGKTAEHFSHSKRSNPSDLYTSSPASCRTTKREDLEKHPRLLWKEKLDEKEKQRSQQINTTKDLPLRDKSWDQTATPGLDGRLGSSLSRKRKLEWDGFITVKRAKQESGEDKFDSSHTLPVQHISDVSVLYANSSRCNVTRTPGGFISYPGGDMYPYQTMWDSNKRMDLYCRQNILRDYSCKAIRIPPPVSERQKEAFHGYFSTPLYFPLALRQQEDVYLRERELLHSHQQSCHFHNRRHQLPHPGFLQTSHLGP